MKRGLLRYAVVSMLVGALLVAGCGDLIDINDKAMIIGVGLDPAGAAGGYEVTAEFQAPSQGNGGGNATGGGGGGQPGGSCQVITSTSVDISRAVTSLRGRTSQLIYFGNLSVIVFGAQLAREGVLAALDYFLRRGEISESVQVIAVPSSARQFLTGPCPPNGLPLSLYEFLRLSEHAEIPTSPNLLWRFLGGTYGPARASYLPLFAPPDNPHDLFRDAGTALFLRGQMVGAVRGYQAQVLDWLLKSGGYPSATIQPPGRSHPLTLSVRKVTRRIRVEGPDEVRFDIDMETLVREAPGLKLDDQDVSALERTASAQIQAQIRQVLDKLQSLGTDVLHINDFVHARYPAAVTDWPAAFRVLHIVLHVQVHIREGGRVV